MTDALPSIWAPDGSRETWDPSPYDSRSAPAIPDQQEYLAPLSASEEKEFRALQSDMGDVKGKNHKNWRDSYWHRPDKQSRFRELAARAEATLPAGASGVGQRANSYVDGQQMAKDALDVRLSRH